MKKYSSRIDLELVKLIIIFILLIVVGGWLFTMLATERNNCHTRGGAYVKGAFGFECVAGAWR